MPAVGPPNPPYSVANIQSPMAVIAVDPVTGAAGNSNVATYTVISTAGTTTAKSTSGAFLGLSVIAVGTAFTATAYDIGTTTNTIMGTQTASAVGQTMSGAPGGNGVRFLSSLVIVTAGTAGQYNALWD